MNVDNNSDNNNDNNNGGNNDDGGDDDTNGDDIDGNNCKQQWWQHCMPTLSHRFTFQIPTSPHPTQPLNLHFPQRPHHPLTSYSLSSALYTS